MPEPASLSDIHRYERACDQAIAMCDGNLRSTIKALIMANEYLEGELQELQAQELQIQELRAAASHDCATARHSQADTDAPRPIAQTGAEALTDPPYSLPPPFVPPPPASPAPP